MSNIRNKNTGTQIIDQFGDNYYNNYNIPDATLLEIVEWSRNSEGVRRQVVGPLWEQAAKEMREELAKGISNKWGLRYSLAASIAEDLVVHLRLR